MYLEKCRVISNQLISDSKYLLTVETKELNKPLPGQFYMVQTNNQYGFLKRPISLYCFENNQLQFYYEVKGRGTSSLSTLKENDVIEIQGPIGTGFSTNLKNKNILAIGGGMGIAPFKQLLKQIKKDNNVEFIAAGKNKEALTITNSFDLTNIKNYLVTDDGTLGQKMNGVEKLNELLKTNKYDLIYCCGPQTMMEKIAEVAIKNNIECEISLESRMACGTKACVGCSIKTINGMKKVCGDGPVFNAKEIIQFNVTKE